MNRAFMSMSVINLLQAVYQADVGNLNLYEVLDEAMAYWYQFYFSTDWIRNEGKATNRREVANNWWTK